MSVLAFVSSVREEVVWSANRLWEDSIMRNILLYLQRRNWGREGGTESVVGISSNGHRTISMPDG